MRKCSDSNPWITDANKASCRCEGAKADFEIEDFWLFCAADDAVEAAPREVFLLMLSGAGVVHTLRQCEAGLHETKSNV